MKSWCGTMVTSMGSAVSTAGAFPSTKYTPTTVDDLPADTAATMLSFSCAFFGAAAVVLGADDFSGAESPQDASARATAIATIHLCRDPVTVIRIALRFRLSRKDGGIVHRRELFEQVRDVPLPVPRIGKPGESARKCRVAPAMRDPGGVMQYAQTPQGFDQRELGVVELAKQLVTFHERRPGRLLAGGIPGQEHPQVLDPRAGGAVVEIDEQRALFTPQDVAGMAVAMDAQGW